MNLAELQSEAHAIGIDHQDQNVVDAVAVGHCHLVKEKQGG